MSSNPGEQVAKLLVETRWVQVVARTELVRVVLRNQAISAENSPQSGDTDA